jgi:hypothetical protein
MKNKNEWFLFAVGPHKIFGHAQIKSGLLGPCTCCNTYCLTHPTTNPSGWGLGIL